MTHPSKNPKVCHSFIIHSAKMALTIIIAETLSSKLTLFQNGDALR